MKAKFFWVFVIGIAGCGAEAPETTAKQKPAATGEDEKLGLDRYDTVESEVSGEWSEVRLIESSHPYGNSYRNSWSVNGSAGATEMRVVFERLELEEGYDFVYVSDARGERVTRHTGASSGREIVVPGDRADLRIATDASVTGWGFRARIFERRSCICAQVFAPVCGNDGRTYGNQCQADCARVPVQYRGECSRAAWEPVSMPTESLHPYTDRYERTWTLSYSGARQIRVHFTKIDVERGYDFVRILDASGRQVHEYTGIASDVTTPPISGSAVQVRLVTDDSVTGYGFSIDRVEVVGGCTVDAECGAGESCTQVQCIRAPCFRVCSPSGPQFTRVTLAQLESDPRAYDGRQVEVVAEPTLSSAICTRIACQPTNQCCNRCSASFSIGGSIGLQRASGEAMGCSGNECTYASNCAPAFPAQGAGEYTFRGTFRAGEFGARQLVVDSFRANGCQKTGCSSHVCANSSVITTCEARPEYGCYRSATCAAQADGFCAWTMTSQLQQCLANAGSSPREHLSRDTPLSVPDATAGGVTSSIEVGSTSARVVRASVAITHPYRGDLRVTIVAPNGQSRVLHDKTGGSFDDLVLEDLDVSSLAGGRFSGTWRLRVEDLARADTGTLNQWSLTFD
jgi:hypothetical protein